MKALVEYSQMRTHLPGFQSFFRFFVLDKLATSSTRVKNASNSYIFVQKTAACGSVVIHSKIQKYYTNYAWFKYACTSYTFVQKTVNKFYTLQGGYFLCVIYLPGDI